MPGSGLIAICPCGYRPNGLVCGGDLDWHYEQWACGHCCTLKSLKVLNHKKFKQSCPSCKKPRYRITDLQYWTPETLKALSKGEDPWSIGKTSDHSEDVKQIRYFCPNCQQFQMKIEEGRFKWETEENDNPAAGG